MGGGGNNFPVLGLEVLGSSINKHYQPISNIATLLNLHRRVEIWISHPPAVAPVASE